MATITATRRVIEANYSNYVVREWSALRLGDDGARELIPAIGDRSIQVSGTFGVGGSVRLEGSLDDVTYAPLTDPQGNPLDFVQGKIETIMELVPYLRPIVTAGDGATNLKVTLCVKGVG
jgi:hypothetical protein